MKNKIFPTRKSALVYFNQVAENHEAFLIYNREEGVYEVITQELYDHYLEEFDLDMELLRLSV